MCESQGLSVLGILSGMPRTVAAAWKPLAVTAAAVAVVSFTATYAVELAAAVIAFVVVMGAVIWRMRLPDRMPQATVTTRPRQGVRAISARRENLRPGQDLRQLPADTVTGAVRVIPPRRTAEPVPGQALAHVRPRRQP